MRRGIDEAILELGALGDRDKILDCFFVHASKLFDFSVLLLVRGDTVNGRNIHGLGAPQGLVQRINLSLTKPGILSRANTLRKAFVAPGPSEEADHLLFGHLGRALPSPLVVPLVVRDRVIGIFVGDGIPDAVSKRGVDAGRPPMELVKDEMVLLSESTGQVLERFILRRKGAGSVPPPAQPSRPPPEALPAFARPAPLPADLTAQRSPMPAPTTVAGTGDSVAEPPSIRRWLPLMAAAVVVLGIGGAVAWGTYRRAPHADAVALPGPKLRGWPREVDPLSVLETARTASALDPRPQIGLIEAEVGPGGFVDFSRPVANPSGTFLRFELLTENVQSQVIVDTMGVREPRRQPRDMCGETACRNGVPDPHCSFAKIFELAASAGLSAEERAFVRYAVPVGARSNGAPEWIIAVAGRGSIRIDPESCKPFAREHLRPAAAAVETIPGAPRVDPIEIIPRAKAHSGLEGDALLLEIDARGVDDRGRVDITQPDHAIDYVFVDAGERRRWRRVTVGPRGMPVAADETELGPLPVRFGGVSVATPRCTFAEARDYLARGTPSLASSRIVFGPDIASGQGGQWSFESANAPARRVVGDIECEAWARLKRK